jgi:hypothetical protein
VTLKRAIEFLSSVPVLLGWINHLYNPLRGLGIAYYRWQSEANTIAATLITIFFFVVFVGKKLFPFWLMISLALVCFAICSVLVLVCLQFASELSVPGNGLVVEATRREWELAYIAMLFSGGASLVLACSAFARDS